MFIRSLIQTVNANSVPVVPVNWSMLELELIVTSMHTYQLVSKGNIVIASNCEHIITFSLTYKSVSQRLFFLWLLLNSCV